MENSLNAKARKRKIGNCAVNININMKMKMFHFHQSRFCHLQWILFPVIFVKKFQGKYFWGSHFLQNMHNFWPRCYAISRINPIIISLWCSQQLGKSVGKNHTSFTFSQQLKQLGLNRWKSCCCCRFCHFVLFLRENIEVFLSMKREEKKCLLSFFWRFHFFFHGSENLL